MSEMEEMKTKQMAEMEEMKTVIAQQRAKHMAEMEEMKAVIEQQRRVRSWMEQQRAWMDNLILTLKNFMKQQEEQEQEEQQGEPGMAATVVVKHASARADRRQAAHGAHSASSHWLTEQCGEKAPKLALPVARTVQTGSAPH